jgi:glycosyltransferase involved in cell wall biosynthesis
MKIIFDCRIPCMFWHGGLQIQIDQTKAALEKIGVEVDYLRWWDGTQTGDILHFFGRTPTALVQAAHAKGMTVVQAELLTGQGSRPWWQHRLHGAAIRALSATLPEIVLGHFNWESYRLADACVALTPWEARLMAEVFRAPRDRVHVIPNGVEDCFLQSAPRVRGDWLVCTATITERKRVLELAHAAVHAAVPLWVIGQPYSDADPYAQQFIQFAQEHPARIRFEGPVSDRRRLAEIYRAARGFVLLSAVESLSLSALEAAACECPLLLSDLPWAKTVFGNAASYCPVGGDSLTARHLREFYDAAPRRPVPAQPNNWQAVAQQLRALYESIRAAR